MSKVPESLFDKILYSLKLESWPKVLVPFIFSVSLVFHTNDFFPISSIFFGLFYIIFLVSYIVHLNDYADQEVDRIKRAMFPDNCSPKTIPDSILTEYQVLGAGILSLSMVMVIGLIGYLFFYASSISGVLLSIVTFWLYSMRPFRLNYRGGGELLEAIGISMVIPLTIFQFFGTDLTKSELVWLIPSFFLALSSAIASGLSDESSDRLGGKRTVVTIVGSKIAVRLLIISFSMGIGMFSGVLFSQNTIFSTISGSIVGLSGIIVTSILFRESLAVRTNAFNEIASFKSLLHKGIWYCVLFVSCILIINNFF